MYDKKTKNKKVMGKIITGIRPYWLLIACSVLFAAISVALTLYIPILTGNAIDFIIEKGLVDFSGVWNIIVKIVILAGITAISQWLMNICNNRITFFVVQDLRTSAFARLEKLPLKYIDGHQHGDLVSRIIADVDQVSDGLLMSLTQFFTGVLTILGTLGFMLFLNWKIAIVVLLITPVSLFVAKFISQKTFILFKKQSEIRGQMTSLVDEMVGNQKIVQAFGREKEVIRQFDEVNDELKDCSLKAIFFSSITNPSTRFVNNLVYTGVGLAGAIAAVSGAITIGQLSVFLSYANQYTKPFNEISGVITEMQNALASASRVFDLIEEEVQVPDHKDARILENPDGRITMEQVYFSYNPGTKLIEQFNLNIKPGQRIAIVGPTGCGKSTIINLLMRFYDVDSGSIKAEGTDIRNITRDSLRKSYGMVLQETWLKSGTMKENISYGKPDASEEEIIEASKAAHSHSFIKRLPNGYDTVITEDGGNLSQGQKQLLCIARVMLCLPPMLILDEATSSIDTRTEAKIQKAFAKMMEGRTSFIVAHRLSTIKEADQILVMKAGNIIEQGTHQELLAQNGFYADLYNSQFAV